MVDKLINKKVWSSGGLYFEFAVKPKWQEQTGLS